MKPITLHPISVLVGAALVGLSLVLSGATQTPGVVHHPRTEVVGLIPAEWWTYVHLSTASDGTPLNTYTVPLDRNLVVTLWEGGACGNCGVIADGQPISDSLLAVSSGFLSYDGSSVEKNGTRVVVPPGTLLSTGIGAQVKLWGYLEPVR